MKENTKNLARIFKALADENRLKILRFVYEKECKCEDTEPLCRNDACIKDLSKFLNVAIPTISHHIKELVNAGLVNTQKRGRWVYCTINRKTFQKACGFLNQFSITKG